MTFLQLLQKIAETLIGIDYDDLTSTERQIFALLRGAKFLQMSEQKTIEKFSLKVKQS